MSLGIVIVSPSGIVLAADSRLTLESLNKLTGEKLTVNYDNATKLLRFNEPNNFVGAITYGQAVIPGENRTAESYLPEFEASLKSKKRLPIEDFAQALSDFFVDQWKSVPANYTGDPMVFQVAGYDEKAAYGRGFEFSVPSKPAPNERVPAGQFGIVWGGQTDIVDRMIKGYGLKLPGKIASTLKLNATQKSQLATLLTAEEWQFPIHVMALQDCVRLVLAVMRSTVTMQQLAVTKRGVGGPVDLVTVTRTEGIRAVQFKEVFGEQGQW